MKWHRQNPKPKTKEEKVTEVKLQVLYNSLLDMVAAFNESTSHSFSSTSKEGRIVIDELPKMETNPLPWDEPKKVRNPKSVVKYVSERLQIETSEDYEDWLKELESDPYLSDRDKKAAKINTL